MIRLTLTALASTGLAVATLSTDYSAERTLKISAETNLMMEVTDFEMIRNGEPAEGRGFGGVGGMEMTTSIVHYDTVLAHEDGQPTKVKRVFDEVEGSIVMGGGEQSTERDRESPMDGETLILTRDDSGDVVAELEDGEAEDGAMLQGHSLELALDALLPEDDVEAGDSWEPEGEDLMRALSMDIGNALFPRPERGEGGERGQRGGGGRGRGMRGGGSSTGFFREAEWESEATLTDRTEDVDGLTCVVIELSFEADGDMPERQGGRREDRAFEPEATIVTRVESTYEVELSGTLYFSVEERRPVKLEIEGEMTIDTEREMSRGDMVMSMSMTQEGTFEHTVEITEESN